uniref:NADH dehydrogenase subunit 6 n=1 Tax=Sigmella ectobioides TaxID=1670702 RepID=UPI0027999713|nr:NADH dehydrogenase subunit 6 [Sigmella ectobioides]WGO57714.1 NADH dehydrogenase subunit 6 [Sigmella ectobioides]
MKIIMSMSMSTSILLTQIKHPLSMGLILLIQTIMISLMSGMITYSFWFSYILLIVFLGGMLILFIYVTSLASNEMFYMSTKIMLTMTAMIILFKIMLNNTEPFMQNTESMTFISTNNTEMLSKLYNQPTKIITVILASYLFLTLITVVKITNLHKGPLRQMN